MPIDSPIRANLPPLSLHIPEPQYRPGDTADFSNIEVLAAGVTPRPDSAADASSMRDMVYGLVRVLDDEGKAVGAWNPRLDADTLRKMLRAMALTRAFDERMFRAQRQGKTSFYMKSTGEEAVAVAATFALQRDDMCFPSYRQQGILIARDWSLIDMMNQIYSNKADGLRILRGEVAADREERPLARRIHDGQLTPLQTVGLVRINLVHHVDE